MNYLFTAVFLFLLSFYSIGQKEYALLPDSSDLVVSLDLKRINTHFPLNESANYQFVGSIFENYLNTGGKSVNLVELGLDLTGKPTYFAGSNNKYSFNGVIIALSKPNTFVNRVITDNLVRKELLENRIYIENNDLFALHDNFYISVSINPSEELAYRITDSIFDANEWKKPFRWDAFWGEMDWSQFDFEEVIEEEDTEIEIIEEDSLKKEKTENPFLDMFKDIEDTDDQRYYDMKDSITLVYAEKYARDFIQSIHDGKPGLLANSGAFKTSINRTSDVLLYTNTQGMYNEGEFPYFRRNPLLMGYDRFLRNTWQAGYLNFTEKGMEIEWVNHVGEGMMRVMRAMQKSKFDKNLLKYIPSYSAAFMTVNINTLDAYRTFRDTYMPVMEKSDEGQEVMAAAIWALIDEMIDDKALFDMYLSKAFVSFNGIRDMEVERITYDYDEESFEYSEIIEKVIDKVPAVTFGMHAPRNQVMIKLLNAISKTSDIVSNEGGYFKLKQGPVPGVPFYIIFRENIMLMTNEMDLVRNYSNGYGKQAISGRMAKSAGNAKMMYLKADMRNIPPVIADLIVNTADRHFVQSMLDQTGELEIQMGSMQKASYSFKGTYEFHGSQKNGAYYLMDVLNLMMSFDDSFHQD